jgi:hypothetical protein
VLGLIADGRTNRQIAETLFITQKTASVHVSNILSKLDVANRGEAAALAHRAGFAESRLVVLFHEAAANPWNDSSRATRRPLRAPAR